MLLGLTLASLFSGIWALAAIVAGVTVFLLTLLTFLINWRNSVESVRPFVLLETCRYNDLGDSFELKFQSFRNIGKGIALHVSISPVESIPDNYGSLSLEEKLALRARNTLRCRPVLALASNQTDDVNGVFKLQWLANETSDQPNAKIEKRGNYSFSLYSFDVYQNRYESLFCLTANTSGNILFMPNGIPNSGQPIAKEATLYLLKQKFQPAEPVLIVQSLKEVKKWILNNI